jgi:chaperone modulatory protein CbpM
MTAVDRVFEGRMLDETVCLGLADVCARLEVEHQWIAELVEVGLLEPRGPSPEAWQFPASTLQRARIAARLAQDLGVNAAGAAVILDLIDERRRLLQRLQGLEQALGG